MALRETLAGINGHLFSYLPIVNGISSALTSGPLNENVPYSSTEFNSAAMQQIFNGRDSLSLVFLLNVPNLVTTQFLFEVNYSDFSQALRFWVSSEEANVQVRSELGGTLNFVATSGDALRDYVDTNLMLAWGIDYRDGNKTIGYSINGGAFVNTGATFVSHAANYSTLGDGVLSATWTHGSKLSRSVGAFSVINKILTASELASIYAETQVLSSGAGAAGVSLTSPKLITGA